MNWTDKEQQQISWAREQSRMQSLWPHCDDMREQAAWSDFWRANAELDARPPPKPTLWERIKRWVWTDL